MSQVVIMGPCTFLVTGAVNGDKSVSTMQRISRTWNTSGIKGFYPGGTAIAFRQVNMSSQDNGAAPSPERVPFAQAAVCTTLAPS